MVKTKKWFGFRLHLLSDITYELPIDYEVTKASNSEVKETEKLLDFIKEKYPEKLEKCRYFLADKGYDSKYGARPLRRTIQTQIEDQLSEKILEGTIRKKTEVRIEKDGDQLKFETV